jgi:hypothetical protein
MLDPFELRARGLVQGGLQVSGAPWFSMIATSPTRADGLPLRRYRRLAPASRLRTSLPQRAKSLPSAMVVGIA